MAAPAAKIVFVMPRCRHDHVRGVHKQAWSLSRAGYDVVLVVHDAAADEYLGMKVVGADAPFESLLRPLLNLPALLRQVRNLKGDLYVLRNPDTIALAIALRLFGHKVIYDTHEDFSKRPLIRDSLPRWARPATARLITAFERLLARITSCVVVTQAQQSETLGGRTLYQPNAPLTSGPILDEARSIKGPAANDDLVLVYVGLISRERGILTMLDIVEAINRDRPCRLELIGWFWPIRLQDEAMQHSGWRYVKFRGTVSHAESLAYITRSDIGLAILDPVADYPTSSITKLYEYMQFGVPFVASDFPAWVVATELGPPGLYVDPESAGDIASAALQLADDSGLRRRMGDAGRKFVAEEFNWERVATPWVKLVNTAVHGDSCANARENGRQFS